MKRVVLSLLMLLPAIAMADAVDTHPNAAELKRILAAEPNSNFKPTGLTRADYLKLIAGNVDCFKRYQDTAGAIIDPVSKGERQYSTPAFATAAGVLVKEAGRADLREPASRALSCALNALLDKRAADMHADFYIPMLVHAYRLLKDQVPAQQSASWTKMFQRIDPESMYRSDLRKMNWNIVSSSGELLRRHDGLVAPDSLDSQWTYLESCLEGHLEAMTPIGLFEDPGAPMAYDAFSRLWLEDAFADNAYAGKGAKRIREFLTSGGLTTLLLLSPSGEWACGGRSGMHQWADIEVATICEINAVRWKQAGRADVAGAFKRAARLAFQSAARWQRPSGELNVVKNRAEPDKRLAYEGYSNHSQYNLLPMAMLAIAYERTDDTVTERPMPSEVGGYVLDARQTFHKIAAAAGSYYVLIDTTADQHYNATGLQRVHRAGVAFPALSDTAAAERAYGPPNIPKFALAVGIAWPCDNGWCSLSDFGKDKPLAVRAARLDDVRATPSRTHFKVVYELDDRGRGDPTVTEIYDLATDGVTYISSFATGSKPGRARLPVLVNDGAADTDVQIQPSSVTVTTHGSATTVQFLDKLPQPPMLVGKQALIHSGYVDEAAADLDGRTVRLQITLRQK